jgi:hypothetical protein
MSEVTNTVTVVAKKENPLLKRKNKFPGETFRLPSKGLMYTNGEIDEEVKDGEVVVYPMTTLDEIYMRTPDMLFQGTAINTVFKRCIPQVKNPLALYANDVDFLLTCLRKVSYGEHVVITHRCDKCDQEKVKNLDYQIPLTFFIQNSKEFTLEDINNLQLTLSSGESIILRPSTFTEMMRIMQINEMEVKTPEEMNEILIGTLSSTIKSVDNTEEKEFIAEWLKTLPTKIIAEFSDKLEKLNRWGPSFEYTIQCRDCGEPQKLNTVINPLYFFILPSNQKTA